MTILPCFLDHWVLYYVFTTTSAAATTTNNDNDNDNKDDEDVKPDNIDHYGY